jgi:hypothetical protein
MKPLRMKRLGLVLAAIAALAAASSGGRGQERPRVTELFAGILLLEGRGGADEAQVTIQKWIVNNRNRMALPKVERGMLLVELQAGSIRTISTEGRARRMEGDKWTLGPGDTMTIETGDDSAILRITLVREP